ncbi:hypothetical protein BCR37DRAFT_86830 [Protomyces lactucae-debilis]|uniref:histidine kinase n=1 Tax=Protomyces lactucae-debilis TaxID=2754530 RepID=A0A1Y2F668_PROLT|nr:uncharacterized protein BCR37DRAFT_86830 [Protomyces lactucae-debilis]ORY79382.1 hypothetical protein BCR37DRAFT_86830 [Protomyces lactucae-debilis]
MRATMVPSKQDASLDTLLDQVLVSRNCGISRALQQLDPSQPLCQHLGGLSQWPIELKLALYQIIHTATPSSLHWRDGSFFFENDPLMRMLGRPLDADQGFVKRRSENNQGTWLRMQSKFDKAYSTGQVVKTDSFRIVVFDSMGALSEIVCSMSFDPVLPVVADYVVGCITTYSQQTEFEALSRGLKQIGRLDERLGLLPRRTDVVPVLLEVLKERDLMCDIPISMIYKVSHPEPATPGKAVELNLLGSVSIPAGHALCPRSLKLDGQVNALQLDKVVLDRQIITQPIASAATRGVPSMSSIPDGRFINFVSIPVVSGRIEEEAQAQVDYVLILAYNPMTERQAMSSQFAGMARHYLETALQRIHSFEAEARARESTKQAWFLRSMMHELSSPLQLILGPASDLGKLLYGFKSKDGPPTVEERSKAYNLATMIALNSKRLKNQLELMAMQLNDSLQLTANCMYEDADILAPLREATADFTPMFKIKDIFIDLILPELEVSTDVWVDVDHFRALLTTVYGILSDCAKSQTKIRVERRLQRTGPQIVFTFQSACGVKECNGITLRDSSRVKSSSESASSTGSCPCNSFGFERASLLSRLNRIDFKTHLREAMNECDYVFTCLYGTDHLDPEKCIGKPMAATPKGKEAGQLNRVSTRTLSCKATSPEACRHRRSICPMHSQILVVDGDERMANYIQTVMLQDFDEVTVLASADEAIEVLQSNKNDGPSLIISSADTTLEGSHAMHVAQFVSRMALSVPIILLSSMVMTKKHQVLGDLFTKVISTPFDPDALRSAVLKGLILSRDRRDAQLYDLFNRYVQVAFFKVNQAGHIQRYSDYWWQLTQHSGGGDSWMESVYEPDRASCLAWWSAGLQNGFTSVMNCRIGKTEASCLSVELRCVACTSPGEDGWIGVLTDCTERTKASERLLKEQQLRAEAAIETKRKSEAFIDLVCHEIRNPINAIKHNNEFVLDDLSALCRLLRKSESFTAEAESLLESSRRSSEVIQECNEHQGRITDDVLNVSKLELNLIEIVSEPFAPVHKVNQLCALFDMSRTKSYNVLQHKGAGSGSLPKNETIIKCQYGGLFRDEACQQVCGDWSRISQCLVNLITNALKFCKDVARPEILVSASLSEQPPFESPLHAQSTEWCDAGDLYLTFSVKDNGKGISQEEQDKLFERFKQASPKTYAKFSGSGLGLWITKQLIGLQGGSIRIDSDGEGKGAEFSFFVRVKRSVMLASQDTAESSSEDSHSPQSSPTRTPNSPMNSRDFFSADELPSNPARLRSNSRPALSPANAGPSRHVLVVEDNQVNQQILKRLLTSLGHDVQCADNGQIGYDVWRAATAQKPFDLVFMDLEM